MTDDAQVFPPPDEERVDLRAEGVSVGHRPRTWLASLALYAPVAYVGAVVLRDSPHAFVLRLVLASTSLVAIARLSPAIDDLRPEARGSARIALVAGLCAVMLATALPAPMTRLADAICTFSACVAAATSLRCAAFIVGLGGLGQARPGTLRRFAGWLGASWLLIGTLEGLRAVLAHRALGERIFTTSVTDVMLGLEIATVLATLAQLLFARHQRRLELGAHERHELLLGTGTLVAPAAILAATALAPFDTDPRAPMLLIIPALCVCAGTLVAQLVRDPVRAASIVARTWIALVFGAVGWGAVVIYAPSSAKWVGPFTVGVGILVGAAAPTLTTMLGLADARHKPLRDAVARARDGAAAVDAREVHRGVLAALRILASAEPPPHSAGGRLLTFSPLEEIMLDGSGEPRSREPVPSGDAVQDPDAPSAVASVVPRELLDLLATEPLGVVRTELLRALEVRRPDLRAALRWCEQRDAEAVVGLVSDGDLEGLLVVPRGPDVKSIGLMHARALRAIASLTTTRLSLDTSLSRSSARTHLAERRTREIEHLLDAAADREARMTNVLRGTAVPYAERIAIGGYAPTSRSLRAELDALARTPNHLLVFHRPGTDPSPYAARLHRESGRRGAFHVVDAARAREAWNDPVQSPIELARDGTLLVLSANRLEPDAQKALVRALAFHTAPSGDPTPIDLRLVLAVAVDDPESESPVPLEGLEPALVGHLRTPALRIPSLARRAEDIRAIALDRLGALGVSRRGEPLGLTDEALALLLDHDWSGDDAELDAVLVAAGSRSTGKRVEARDVRACLPPKTRET